MHAVQQGHAAGVTDLAGRAPAGTMRFHAAPSSIHHSALLRQLRFGGCCLLTERAGRDRLACRIDHLAGTLAGARATHTSCTARVTREICHRDVVLASSRLFLTPTGSGSTEHIGEKVTRRCPPPPPAPGAHTRHRLSAWRYSPSRRPPPHLPVRAPSDTRPRWPAAPQVPIPGPIELQPGVYEVGRSVPADIQLAIPTVSSRHALLRVGEWPMLF